MCLVLSLLSEGLLVTASPWSLYIKGTPRLPKDESSGFRTFLDSRFSEFTSSFFKIHATCLGAAYK